jgi:aminoglycoside phosphotransferase (APT) family kinase protein
MIETLVLEVKAAWSELAPGRPAPRHVHALKWNGADYPNPANALLVFLFADDDSHPSAVAKVARVASGDAAIVREARSLESVRGVLPDDSKSAVPVPVRAGAINGRAYLLTSAVAGETELHHTWGARVARRADRRIALALAWCTRMAEVTTNGTIAGARWLDAPAEALLDRMAALGLAAEARSKLAARLPQLLATEWPAGFAHGDFFPGNVVFAPAGRIGVVDWALAEPMAPLFFDALTYEMSFALHTAFSGHALAAGEYARVHDLDAFVALREHWKKNGMQVELGSDARLATALHAAWRDGTPGAERAQSAGAWVRVLESEIGFAR